ncbi:MAG: FkbM family methyltransferase [Chloroflexi bacterium]|nr:FkbM family methyltransferase [Chloroflexota bacterium]
MFNRLLHLIYAPLRPLPLPRRIYRRLGFRGDYAVRIRPGTTLRLVNPPPHRGPRVYWDGLYKGTEPQSMRLWTQLVRRARVIGDVGAYHGIYALTAAALNPAAHVAAFEPLSLNARILRANNVLNGSRVDVVQAAVSDRVGEAAFGFNPGRAPSSGLIAADNRPEQELVPLTTLAVYCEQAGLPGFDLLKIDVEMHEPQVLRGMGAGRPILLIEVLSDAVGAQIAELLPDYLYYWIDEDHGPRRRERLQRLAKHSRNYLLCPAEKHDLVEQAVAG